MSCETSVRASMEENDIGNQPNAPDTVQPNEEEDISEVFNFKLNVLDLHPSLISG